MKPPEGWLPPDKYYYTAPKYDNINTPNGPRPPATAMMQAWLQGVMSWPNGFYWGAMPKPDVLLQQAIDMAKSLTIYSWSPWTTVGFNPTAAAVSCMNLLIEHLKQVPATMAYSLADPNASIYDVWITH